MNKNKKNLKIKSITKIMLFILLILFPSTIVKSSTLPNAPTNFFATARNNQIILYWDKTIAKNNSTTGYNIYQATSYDSISTTTPINSSVINSTTYTVNGLRNGTTYFYAIAAVDNNGVVGKISAITFATPYSGPYYQFGTKKRIGKTKIIYNIKIHGNKVIWKDIENGIDYIHAYDVNTDELTKIVPGFTDEHEYEIYNNKIVWGDKKNGNYDVYMHDLDTSNAIKITSDKAYQHRPSIFNNKIVWEDYRKGNYDIYMHDLDSGVTTQITTNSASQSKPDIHNNKIVWEDFRNGNSDIYMYNLDTLTETQITADSSNQRNPSIYNNKIIYEGNKNGNWDIYVYDFVLGVETRITYSPRYQFKPLMDNNKIVWGGLKNDKSIYLYDIATKNEYQISPNSSIRYFVDVYNDKVVWLEYDSVEDKYDIYMRTFYTIPNSPENLTADGANPSPQKDTTNFSIDWTNPYDSAGIKGYWYKLGSAPKTDEDGIYSTIKPFNIEATDVDQMLYIWLENNNGYKNHNNNASVKLRYHVSYFQGFGNPDEVTLQKSQVFQDGTQVNRKIIEKYDFINNIEQRIAETTLKLAKNIKNNQTISLNSSDISQISEVSLYFTKDILQNLASSTEQVDTLVVNIISKKPIENQKDSRMFSDKFEVFEISAFLNGKEIKQFSESLNLSFDLSQVEAYKSDIKVYYFNEPFNTWKLIGNGGQLIGNKLNININNLSNFALLKTLPKSQKETSSILIPSVRDQELDQILSEANDVFKSGTNLDNFINYNNAAKNITAQKHGMKTYAWPLVGDDSGLNMNQIYAINNFIVYSTPSTRILGTGERAGVVSSYKRVFGKFPVSISEWRDLIAIANGRWPSATNQTVIEKAKKEFEKIYMRQANMENQNDNAAVTIMAYGLRPKKRNLDSETTAIKSFEYIYGYHPKDTTDWDTVRAISYSGATRASTNKGQDGQVCLPGIKFNQDLERGSYTYEVVELQKFLKCLGYFPEDLSLTTYFGNATKKAVQQFQIDNNIISTGNVSYTTRSILNSYK